MKNLLMIFVFLLMSSSLFANSKVIPESFLSTNEMELNVDVDCWEVAEIAEAVVIYFTGVAFTDDDFAAIVTNCCEQQPNCINLDPIEGN